MGEKTTCGDDDFFIQILVCLPVKSLLRFKSVCKSWRTLIESSFFIDLHTTTFNSSKFGTFILQGIEHSTYKYESDIKLFMLSSESGDGDAEDDFHQGVFKVDELGFFPFYKDFMLTDTLCMVGSCNGIICLHDSELMEDYKGCRRHHYSNLRDVSLWNPATRQFRILSKSIPIEERRNQFRIIPNSIPIEERSNQEVCVLPDFVAFGFDVKTKDYKVLRITPLLPCDDVSYKREEEGCMWRVQVYSLSTDSWRLLEGINYLPLIPEVGSFHSYQHGIYLNGSYFFVVRSFQLGICHYKMLSFDFTKEVFTTIQLPDNNSMDCLSYLGDKIVVFTTRRINGDVYDGYDIWVLNEQHGSVFVTKESWTKLHSLRLNGIRSKPGYYGLPKNQPKGISNNGEFALISTHTDDYRINLQLFNIVTQKTKEEFRIGYRDFRADVYKESLVSIMGGNVLLRWQLPTTHGTYKLNLEAPFIDPFFCFGIGLCLTSDTGGCIGVRSLCRHVEDAEEGEALAMLEAIKWAQKLELSPIILESNSKNCVSFLMDDDECNLTNCRALSLLRDAKLLLLNSSELGISLQYCSRSCNYVADVAAKLSLEKKWHCKDWTANFPGEVVMCLNEDLGLLR